VEDSIRALSIKYVIAIGLALPILYYFFYFKAPNEMALISSSEEKLIALDGEIKRLDREISEGDQVRVNLEVIKKEIKALSTYFDAEPNSKSIEQIISEEARATGISFTSLQPVENQGFMPTGEESQGPSAADFIERSLIAASFTGTFIELMRFLSYLSRTDRIVSLKKIELRGGENGGSSNLRPVVKLSFQADFETYKIIKNVNSETLAPQITPEVVE
jgi:Tfp pilus assembly protein PilO